MTAVAFDPDRLRELDAGTEMAWRAYSDGLRGIPSEEYERAEADAWDELQRELRGIERRRKALSANSA